MVSYLGICGYTNQAYVIIDCSHTGLVLWIFFNLGDGALNHHEYLSLCRLTLFV